MALELAFNLKNNTNQPLDASAAVQNYADLKDIAIVNPIKQYNGKIFVVLNDPDSSLNGNYELLDKTNSTSDDAWQRLGSGGSSAGIFITNITAETSGLNVQKTLLPDPNGGAVSSILTADTSVRVFVEWDRGEEFQGSPTVNDVAVTNISKVGGSYTGEAVIDITGLSSIDAVLDGFTYTVNIAVDDAPEVLNISFGSMPGTQTALKAGDTIDVTVDVDIDFTSLEIKDSGLFGSQTIENIVSDDNGSGGFQTTVTLTVANRSITTTQLQTATIAAVSNAGSTGPDLESLGINYNNAVPSMSGISIDYPITQGAIKSGESADISYTVANTDSINAVALQDVIIDNVSNAETNVTYSSGSYNVSTNNVRFDLTKNENGATASYTAVVKIANATPSIISSNVVTVRSGETKNIPTEFDQIVTVNSFNITNGSSSFTTGATSKNQDFDITAVDTDTLSSSEITAQLVGVNLANVPFDLNRQYKIKGFASRTISIDYPATEIDIGVNVVDTGAFSATNGRITTATPYPIGTGILDQALDAVNKFDIQDQAGGLNGKTVNNLFVIPDVALMASFGYDTNGISVEYEIEEVA